MTASLDDGQSRALPRPALPGSVLDVTADEVHDLQVAKGLTDGEMFQVVTWVARELAARLLTPVARREGVPPWMA